MKRIYADNAATTPVSPTARRVNMETMDQAWGNPSSLHTTGQKAAEVLLQARQTVAQCLNAAREREITFTSGGSEADNQALLTGAMLGRKKGKTHIISTKFEHHAVLHGLKRLEKEGFTVTLLDVGRKGLVTPEQVEAAITPETCLVSIMFANNEVGTIQPIAEIGAVCQKHGVLFHTDAVQAVGHVPIDVQAMHIDLLSLSGHKFGAPKGVGALYARTGVWLTNLIEGGAQERGKRAGTENVPGIAALAAALQEACSRMPETAARVTALRDRLLNGLCRVPMTLVNGDTEHRLPGNVNVCFQGIEGESLLLLLDAKGIEGSSGSACTSGSLDPSHVLLALGLPHEVAHGSLRLTLSDENTEADVDYMIEQIPQVVSYLRSISPVWEAIQKGEIHYAV